MSLGGKLEGLNYKSDPTIHGFESSLAPIDLMKLVYTDQWIKTYLKAAVTLMQISVCSMHKI